MPSPLTLPSSNSVKKRRVIPDAFSTITTTTTSPSSPTPADAKSHPQNGSSRSARGSIVVSSTSSSPASSPEKKAKRHTVGSLRKLFGNSTRASFDSSEGLGGSVQDDHTSIKSGRASSLEDRRPALASTGSNSANGGVQDPKDVTQSHPRLESDPDLPADPSLHPPPPPATAVAAPASETNTDIHHHHACREQELQQSLSAVKLELHRLKERVRLLSAENDGFKNEVVNKHIELEERETKVLELKLDVEIEREKVKKVMEEGAAMIDSLKERGVASRSSSLLMTGLDLGLGFKVQEVENGRGPGEPVVLVEDGGVTTDWSEDTHVADGIELVQDPGQAIVKPAEAIIFEDIQASPVDALSTTAFTLTKVDVATNTGQEEESESDKPGNEEPELLALKDTLDQQTKTLTDLTSMNDSNSTIKQRLVKFNSLRSQLVLLIEQTNLEAVTLHKELDRNVTWFLVLVFGFLIFGLFVISLMCLYKFLLDHDYVPEMSMTLCRP